MTTQLKFKLKKVETITHWNHYHRIRKIEIFDPLPNIVYDYNHPSLTNPKCTHYVFYKNYIIIGTIFTEELSKDKVALRVVAIDKRYQNYGYGTILLNQIEQIVHDQGYTTILVHVNIKAYNFYKRSGYSEMEFDEPNHLGECIDMGKILIP